ncbi:MAG: hypothetical protein M1816_005844 [Peltula sp. TS41687]|nr:MAG: hypothetical protein M1816_005844 [Peltula sp. TS41687]
MNAFNRTTVTTACIKQHHHRLRRTQQVRRLNLMITPSPQQPASKSSNVVTARDSTPIRRMRTTSSLHMMSPVMTMHPTPSSPTTASTVDRTFFPFISDASGPSTPNNQSTIIKVPYLPDNYTRKSSSSSSSNGSSVARSTSESDQVFRAQIATVAGESTHPYPPSPLSDVVDNGAIHLGDIPYDLSTKVGQAARKLMSEKVAGPMEEGGVSGVLKHVWKGIVDDVLGPPSSSSSSSGLKVA